MPNKFSVISAVCVSLVALSSPVFAQTTDTTSTASTLSDAISRNGFLLENGLKIPAFDPAKGRKLFGSKGCVVCHSINGLGGGDAPDLSAANMEKPMNAFDFAAKMWRGAPAMIAMQDDELGAQIEFTGAELADIIAFAHDQTEQAKFSRADVPAKFLKKIDAN